MNTSNLIEPTNGNKPLLYGNILRSFQALTEDERDFGANAANCSALLYQNLPSVNWAGFYWLRGTDLVLGSFQGNIACTRIALGRGVCGTAALEQKVIIVPNVHEFPGHIACDSASRSEIVIPIVGNNTLLGVLDIDSPDYGRFDEEDKTGLTAIVGVLLANSNFSDYAC